MRYFVISLFFLAASCQPKSKPIVQESPLTDTLETPTLPPDEIQCGFHQSGKRPETTFPFSESDRIELVSYEAKPRLMKIHDNELVRDGKFIVPDIHQRVTLTKRKTDSLFSILYNFVPLTSPHSWAVPDCYEPHQAVVFYKNEKAFAFLEICFTCHQTRQTKGMDVGFFCSDKYCILERFFIQNKVDYGLILEQYDVECASAFDKEKNHQ
jgi:hypothetical protein